METNQMKDVLDRVIALKAGMLALEQLVMAVCEVLPPAAVPTLRAVFANGAEAGRATLLNSERTGELLLERFDYDIQRLTANLQYIQDR